MVAGPEPNPLGLPVLALPFRPEAIVRMQVRAVYLEGQIDLRAFRKRHADSPVLSTDPLILEVTPAGFIAVTKRTVTVALHRFEPVVAELEATGNLRLPVGDALRSIGFALKVRSSVLANLTLFDKPPETWGSEILERLDNQLYDFFDLEERLSAINQKMAYFTDMSSTLTGLLNQRRSWQLEIAIIALILLEVVIFVWSLAR